MNRYTWRTGIFEGFMILLALIFLIPIYLLVNLSVRPESDLSSPFLPTLNPEWGNFAEAWTESGLGWALVNSVLLTVVSVTLLLLVSSIAAYPLARLTSGWSSAAFYVFMIGLLLPFQLGLIPLYNTFVDLGMLGTPLPLVFIYVGLRIPFTVFLYVQFLRQVPTDYEEAASIDGAGPIKTFLLVVLPMVRPVTGTALILNGLFIWNDFLKPELYLSGTRFETVPIAIYSFVGEYRTDWPLVFSALLLATIPILFAFFFIQKSLIRGLASGVKG